VVDSIIAGWLQQLSSVSPAPLRAERIEIEFEAPDYRADYEVLGDCPIQFGCEQSAAPGPGESRSAQP
jgi:hypothetical protein